MNAEGFPTCTGRRTSPALRTVLLAGAVLWVVITWCSSLRKSAAVDELPHIGAGLAMWKYHDYRMNPEHPPLAKLLATAPVYFFNRPDLRIEFGAKRALSGWLDSLQNEFGYHILFRGGKDPLELLAWARVVPTLIGLLGGWFAFLWGRELSGRALGGAASAFALLVYPEYIGHSRLVTLDVPTLVGCAAVSWFAWRWWRRPGWKTATAFVATVAIASQFKLPVTVFTAFVLATCGLLSLIRLLRGVRGSRTRMASVVLAGVGVFAAFVFASWASAGFRYRHYAPGNVPEKIGQFIPRAGAPASGLRGKLVQFCCDHQLLPEATLATVNHVGSFEGRKMFLLGEYSRTGWYSYFFITFLLKTPITYMVALVCATAVFIQRKLECRHSAARHLRRERAAFLAIPFLLLFALYCKSRPDIGHRQVLFIYFPLAAFIGPVAARAALSGNRVQKRVVQAFALVLGAIAILAFPNYETYFNEVIRTPYRAESLLHDSNVDWATDVARAGRLAQEFRTDGIRTVNYAVFGPNNPASYGILSFNWLLPSYPFAMYMPPAVEPDPALPSIISLHCLADVRTFFPAMYSREPDIFLNSIVVYLPRK